MSTEPTAENTRHACFEKFDGRLEPYNARLAFALTYTEKKGLDQLEARLLITTEKTDKHKRGAVPSVVATHCPFCGAKLVEV